MSNPFSEDHSIAKDQIAASIYSDFESTNPNLFICIFVIRLKHFGVATLFPPFSPAII
jgi:hypothetical protein